MCNELDDLKSHCTVRSDMFNVLISEVIEKGLTICPTDEKVCFCQYQNLRVPPLYFHLDLKFFFELKVTT